MISSNLLVQRYQINLWFVFRFINTSFQHYCHHAKSLMNKPYHCGFFFKIWDQVGRWYSNTFEIRVHIFIWPFSLIWPICNVTFVSAISMRVWEKLFLCRMRPSKRWKDSRGFQENRNSWLYKTFLHKSVDGSKFHKNREISCHIRCLL